jgi:hypothetical protein
MNTNITTPHLAKVVGLETKSCLAVIRRNSGAYRSITMGLATAVLLASVGVAAAEPRYHLRTDRGTRPMVAHCRPDQITVSDHWES